MVWAAVPAQADTDDEVPARITFLRRRRAGAARVDAENSAAAADAAAAEFIDGDERRVFLSLAAGGAQYLDQLAERAGLAERTALAALWRLAAAGRVSNDSFAPLRLLWAAPEAMRAMAPGPHRRARHDAALRARLRSSVTGRWSALGVEAASQTAAPPPAAAIATPPGGGQSRSGARGPLRDSARDPARDLARERAEKLLERNGIVTREMLGLESAPMAWQEISFALRRMEYAGAIRRGYFVRALSGEQYALPAALEMLAASRKLNPAREHPLALSAADPANPYGAVLPGCGVAREVGNFVVRAGRTPDDRARGARAGQPRCPRRRSLLGRSGSAYRFQAQGGGRNDRRGGGARLGAGRRDGCDGLPFGRAGAGLRRIARAGAVTRGGSPAGEMTSA